MNGKIDIPGEDHLIRCPRLGHPISFLYCQKENDGLPCFKILDCWFQHFNVEEYLRNRLTEKEWEMVFEKPTKSKVQSLIELIEEAKKRSETS
ncbi:hypothetical protein ACFL1N_06840 [Thermodesulfobacteriota bacterium]